MNKKIKLKVIDLFSGVGGLSYGFAHDNNFEIIAANEILPNMAKAYSLNHPTAKVYAEDIKDFNAAKIEKDFNDLSRFGLSPIRGVGEQVRA